jgi:hypothetical protein
MVHLSKRGGEVMVFGLETDVEASGFRAVELMEVTTGVFSNPFWTVLIVIASLGDRSVTKSWFVVLEA